VKSLQFTHNGRQLEVKALPTVGGFRIAVWDGGRNVSPNDTVIDQATALAADAHGGMEQLFDAAMQRARDAVVSGQVTLLP
jgi:hypothetical protein